MEHCDSACACLQSAAEEGSGNRTFETPKSPVTIDQKGCQYSPHVVALQAGQMLDVVNSDRGKLLMDGLRTARR